LVNLWSVTCSPCLAELEEWKQRHDDLTKSGFRVLALCVDGLQEADPSHRRQAEDFIWRLSPPFASGLASNELVEAMEIVHRAYLELQLPLPVPSSFLLDARGRTAAIYKGRVSVEQLTADAQLLSASLEQQRLAAIPFPGRMASLPFPPDPARIASGYLTAGKSEAASAYLGHFLTNPAQWFEGQHVPDQGAPIVAECASLAGEILLEQGRAKDAARAWAQLLSTPGTGAQTHRLTGERLLQQNLAAEALPHLERALAAAPVGSDAALRFNIGLARLGTGQPAKAVEDFRAALAIEPNDLPCVFQLGNALLATGDPAGAAASYREALRLQPGWPYAARQLAWILATDPDPNVRDGSEAVTLARDACTRASFRDPVALHLLSAALAETGEFAAAIETADQALALLKGNAAGLQLAAQVRRARQQYEQGQPLRRQR
jgi:tetratricopeptide (TPR) repeat protein